MPGTAPWEFSHNRIRADELRTGDFLSYQYEVVKVEHGGKPHTVRVTLKGGGRVTLRDDYRVHTSRESFGGESFFSENKTLHKDDPAIKGLVRTHGSRLHIAEDGEGWDTPAVQRHLRGLQEVPAAHQRFLARSHVEVYVGTEPSTKQDRMGYLSKTHPAGYPEGDTYDQCGALFHSPEYDTTRKPEFGKTYNPPMTAPGRIVLGDTVGSGSVNTAAHETGHALDKFLGEDVFFRGAGELSMTGDFQGIYKRFASKSEGGIAWVGDPYYLQEGNRGAPEFFAETYAAWVHTAGRPSQYRAQEIMDAVGMHEKTTRITDRPGGGAKIETIQQDPATKRKAERIRREIGNQLIDFYDGLDARIRGATKRLPPPRMKAGAK